MLKRRAQAFDNPDWLFDLKYDGFRALLEIDGAGARLVSRNRNRFKHMDALAATLAKRLRINDAILDGELICALRAAGPSSWISSLAAHPLASSLSICFRSMARICVRCRSSSVRHAS